MPPAPPPRITLRLVIIIITTIAIMTIPLATVITTTTVAAVTTIVVVTTSLQNIIRPAVAMVVHHHRPPYHRHRLIVVDRFRRASLPDIHHQAMEATITAVATIITNQRGDNNHRHEVPLMLKQTTPVQRIKMTKKTVPKSLYLMKVTILSHFLLCCNCFNCHTSFQMTIHV